MVTNAFDRACSLLESVLTGPARTEIVRDAAAQGSLGRALGSLRERMRAHEWHTPAREVHLGSVVAAFDSRIRATGFHALHDWDGKAELVNTNAIAVDVVTYVINQRGHEAVDPVVVAVVLDYYFLYLLAMIALAAWDEPDPNSQLDRVDRLLAALQGPDGSGQQFADDAETLMLLSTSHYESDDSGYDRLLAISRRLNPAHQVRLARIHASSLGCHLRFGIEATYGRDYHLMRDDNGVDYRWLGWSLAVLLREYARRRGGSLVGPGEVSEEALVEAIVSGLTADARAFAGADRHRMFDPIAAEWDEARAAFDAHRADLAPGFARYRPTDVAYAPIALFYNFAYNVVKGAVVDAVFWSEPWRLSLNAMLESSAAGSADSRAKTKLATTLMAYAKAHPDRIRGQLLPVIVYDPPAGRRNYSLALRDVLQFKI